jgi:hypothetical protein
MPVSSENYISGPYFPNGSTTGFPFDFKAASANEVVAVDSTGAIIPKALYSVTLDSDEGGTLTFSTAPAAVDYPEIHVMSDPDLTQPSNFDNAGPSFNPAALTKAVDRAAIRDLKLKREIDRSLKVGFGEEASVLPTLDELAGKFLGVNAERKFYAAPGTGNDSAFRGEMANRNIGPTLIGVGPNGRSLRGQIEERHNVRDFGAFGDNVPRPLSTFYGTLAAAQAEFPAATSLTDLIDGLAINKALKVVAESAHGRGIVYAPAGRYRGNTGSLLLPQFCTFEGDGAGQTIIDNQSTPVAYPLVVNRDPAGVLFTTVRGISFHGGTVGMDFSGGGEVTGMAFDDISFALQSQANMKVGSYLQTSTFYRVGFGGDPFGYTRGLWQTGSISNANTFDDCEFTSHRLEHLWLNSPENVRIRGGRFESAGQPEANITASIATTTLTVTVVANGILRAGALLIGANIAENTVITGQLTGTAGGTGTYSVNRSQTAASAAVKGYTPTIRFSQARSVSISTYMEATHEYAMVETDSLSGVKFDGTHFTGAYVSAAFIPYKFDSLGTIQFGSNSAFKAFPGPRRMLVTGSTISTESGLPCLVNPDADTWLYKTDRGGKGTRRKVNFTAAQNFSLMTFTRSADSGGQMVEGVVSVMMAGATAGGGLPSDKIVRIPFALAFRQGYVAELGVTTAQIPYDPSSGYTIVLAAISATNTVITLQVQCSGANGAGQSYAVASIDYTNFSDGAVSLKAEFA